MKLAFEHNGLTWAISSDHARELIQNRIKEIKSLLLWPKTRKDIFLTWIQVHIPSLVLYPPQFTTRFSNMYIVDDDLGGTRLRAFNRLKAVLEAGKIGDPCEEPGKKLAMREGFNLQAGTVLRWDNELLRCFSESQTLPLKNGDAIILSVINGETSYDFTFWELELVCANLEEETKRNMKGDTEGTVAELLGRLLMHRFPYKDELYLGGP